MAETPDGTLDVLGKSTINPTFTELPTGKVPWNEVTVYWVPLAMKFQDDVTEALEGRETVRMMLLTGQFPLLVTTIS